MIYTTDLTEKPVAMYKENNELKRVKINPELQLVYYITITSVG